LKWYLWILIVAYALFPITFHSAWGLVVGALMIGFDIAFLFCLASLARLIGKNPTTWVCVGILLTPIVAMIAMSSFTKEVIGPKTNES